MCIVLYTTVSSAKTAEPIRVPFMVATCGGTGNRALDGIPDLQGKGQFGGDVVWCYHYCRHLFTFLVVIIISAGGSDELLRRATQLSSEVAITRGWSEIGALSCGRADDVSSVGGASSARRRRRGPE